MKKKFQEKLKQAKKNPALKEKEFFIAEELEELPEIITKKPSIPEFTTERQQNVPAMAAKEATPFIPEDELLEHNLSRDMESDSNIKTVSKELFSSKDIDLKTEVSHNEINEITKINFLKARWGVDNIEVLTDSFLRLRVSKERKSRREFVETVQLEGRNQQGGSFLSRMFGGGGNGGGN